MTLFNPILNGDDSPYHRPSSIEVVFIRAHGLHFIGRSRKEYSACVEQLVNQRRFETFIKKAGTRFREGIGAYAAMSTIAAIFQFGACRPKGGSLSLLRLCFEASRSSERGRPRQSTSTSGKAIPSEALSEEERQTSLESIELASSLCFGIMRLGLRQAHDPNVLPMLHVYFALIWSFCSLPEAMSLMGKYIPWLEIEEFLNRHISKTDKESLVFSEVFPLPGKGSASRPLLEDYTMRGQVYTDAYFPDTFFLNFAADQEERDRELPSMKEIRDIRLGWLGFRIASDSSFLTFDRKARKFTVTQYAKELRERHPLPIIDAETAPPRQAENTARLRKPEGDTAMSGVSERPTPLPHTWDSPPRKPWPDSKEGSKSPVSPRTPVKHYTRILRHHSKGDVEMPDAISGGRTNDPGYFRSRHQGYRSYPGGHGSQPQKPKSDSFDPDLLSEDITFVDADQGGSPPES